MADVPELNYTRLRAERRALPVKVWAPLLLLSLGAFVAVIIFPTVGHGNARQAAVRIDLASLSSALDTFAADVGRYPTTSEGLQVLLAPAQPLAGWKGPYIRRLYKDPWGNPYVYRCPNPADETTLQLLSKGPDGIEGTADDVTSMPNGNPGNRRRY